MFIFYSVKFSSPDWLLLAFHDFEVVLQYYFTVSANYIIFFM